MTNVVDSIKDFALPERKLFPCDTPSLTSVSAEAFEKESHKLPAQEKIAAAIHINSAAVRHGVDISGTAARRIGFYATDEKLAGVGDFFKVAMGSRREAVSWNGEPLREIKAIEKLAALVQKQSDHRTELLKKLASAIEDFDRKWDLNGLNWRDTIPDAADTVFAFGSTPEIALGVDAGTRIVTKNDFMRFNKEAATKKLSAEAMKSAENFDSFKTADYFTRTAIAEFIPEV